MVSGDVEEPAERLANDLAGGGVVCAGAGFNGCAELGVEAHRDDLRGARAPWMVVPCATAPTALDPVPDPADPETCIGYRLTCRAHDNDASTSPPSLLPPAAPSTGTGIDI